MWWQVNDYVITCSCIHLTDGMTVRQSRLVCMINV